MLFSQQAESRKERANEDSRHGQTSSADKAELEKGSGRELRLRRTSRWSEQLLNIYKSLVIVRCLATQ